MHNKRCHQKFFEEEGERYILIIYLIRDKNFRIEVCGVTKHIDFIIRELSEKESNYYLGSVDQLAEDLLVSLEMKKIVIKRKEIKRTDPYEDFKDDAQAFDDMDFSQNPGNDDSSSHDKLEFDDNDDELESSSEKEEDKISSKKLVGDSGEGSGQDYPGIDDMDLDDLEF